MVALLEKFKGSFRPKMSRERSIMAKVNGSGNQTSRNFKNFSCIVQAKVKKTIFHAVMVMECMIWIRKGGDNRSKARVFSLSPFDGLCVQDCRVIIDGKRGGGVQAG